METIIGTPRAPGNGASNSSALIKDGTVASFARDVLEASFNVPVIVDFWAPWCGPCKQLTPLLEKMVTAAAGAVLLVKINVDENQMLAQQLRVQSLPTVMAFKAGRPVDGFQGALPESQLKQFLTALIGEVGPTPVEAMLAAGEEALAAGALEEAAACFAEVLVVEPEEAQALGRLAQVQIRLDDIAGAEATLAAVPAQQANHGEVTAARAALALAAETREAGDPAEFAAKLAADPDDHQARFDYALALLKAGDYDRAGAELVEIVRRDRTWNDDAARKQLLKMFDALGQTSPFTLAARRKLSSVLFS